MLTGRYVHTIAMCGNASDRKLFSNSYNYIHLLNLFQCFGSQFPSVNVHAEELINSYKWNGVPAIAT